MTIENAAERRKAGRPGITYRDVEAAANALIAQNKPVTQKAIREVFGSGSDSTIGPFLREWKAAQPKIVAAPVVLPEGLNAAILHEIEKRQAEAREPLQAEIIDNEATIKILEAQCNDLATERDSLLIEVTDLTTARDTHMGESNQKSLEIEELRKEVKREQERSVAAQTETAKASLKIEQLTEKNDELKSENSALTIALKDSEVAKNSAEKVAEVNASKLEDAIKREKRLEEERQSFHAEIQKINSELNRVNNELSSSMAKLSGMQETLNAANRDIKRLEDECKLSKKESFEYQKLMSELSVKAELDKARISELELQINKLRVED